MVAGKLGKVLVDQGLVTKDQLAEAVQFSKTKDTRLGSALVQLGHVNENVFATFLAKVYGLNAVSLENVRVPKELVEIIPRHICERHSLLPLAIEGNKIIIALADPTNVAAVDDVRFLCNLEVSVFVATESAILALIDKTYSKFSEDGGKLIETKIEANEIVDDKTGIFGVTGTEINVENAKDKSEKPTIRIINLMFVEAIKRKASDIHIEPYADTVRVRFRQDGQLHEVMKIPPELRISVPSRIKVMASLDISEKRLPQDGRIQVKTKRDSMDVRVSVLPTIYGEKVVLRLLDSGNEVPNLHALGFAEEQERIFEEAVNQPFGMVLVTGPTGSGKSTTLYAALNELNTPAVNISTVEDPVEYKMSGVNQIQVRENIGLSFASALRSFLRQDPDIIMLGEIRDAETAEIAIKASLTGHMVFSTLHTNDAPSTVTRLIHMGVEPFLITASLVLVQAQRLVRIICPACGQPDTEVTEEQLLKAELAKEHLGTFTPMRGIGCDYCGGTGYKGRRGIFEVLPMTEGIRDLVIRGTNADQIKKLAIEQGMMTLRQSALIKLREGKTTLEEVLNNSKSDGDFSRKK